MANEGPEAKPAESTETKPAEQQAAPDARVHELSQESAAYRTQRNEALRKAHAYETMLKAHSIDTTGVTNEVLAGLPIQGGKVDGQFAYKAPALVKPAQEPGKVETSGSLTLDDVKTWSHERISKEWDKVSALLSQGAK